MDTWHIPPSTDDAFGIAEVAEEIATLGRRLRSALELADCGVLVWELQEDSQSVGRAYIQVRVSIEHFEAFFNSSSGYRAMFRRGRRIGSAANAALIDTALVVLRDRLPESVDALLVKKTGNGLQIAGRTAVDRSKFLRSLDPSLAKVWYATEEITLQNIRWLSTGVANSSEIDVGLDRLWKKIEQDPGNCIIELKGAFVAPFGLFQKKDPELRATGLAQTGSA